MKNNKYLWVAAMVGVMSWCACQARWLGAAEKNAPAHALSVSAKGGVFASNVIVTLSTTAREIRYTLDGSRPGTNSPLYKAPLTVTNSVLLRARAYSADFQPSEALAETYTVLETNVLDFSSSLPLVVINTFGQSINHATNLLASIRFINTATNQRATLVASPDFDGQALIRQRGYTSLRYPKKSFSIEIHDNHGEAEPVSILGLPKESDWVLYGPYPDKTLMRDVLAYELSKQMGYYSSRTRFVEVFVNETTNRLSRTNYSGVYVLEEKVKWGPNRVAIHKLSAHDQAEPNITGGYIFKKDHLEEAAGEALAELQAHFRVNGVRAPHSYAPGGFPGDPAGFAAPPPDPVFTNAVSITTNIINLTNVLASTNVIVPTLALTVVATNTLVVTNNISVTNAVAVTNMVVLTNIVVATNAVVTSKTVVATNPVVASTAVAGTNAVATTNAVDANTTVVTTTVSIMTSTTYRTNLVVATNTLAMTNSIVTSNIVFRTNAVISTNLSVANVSVMVTNTALGTNIYVLGSPKQPLYLERLAAGGQGFVTSRTNAFFYVEPKATKITAAQRMWLSNHVNRLEQALYGPDFRNPTNGYAAFIDVDSFIDHHIFVEATKNIDGFRFSTFYTKDRGGKIRLQPIWDWNLSFGNAKGKQGYMYEHWYWPQLDDQQYSWFRRLFEDPDFAQRYVDRWAQWRTNVFASSNLLARIDQLTAFLKEPAARNYERWPILGQVVGPEHFAGKTYEEDVGYMKEWITNRLAWMNAQFLAPPLPSLAGGTVTNTNVLTFAASTGQVYFTLDGTDPRVSGGVAGAGARPYQGPIAVTNNVTVVARAQKDNRWSSPVTLKFVRPPTAPGG